MTNSLPLSVLFLLRLNVQVDCIFLQLSWFNYILVSFPIKVENIPLSWASVYLRQLAGSTDWHESESEVRSSGQLCTTSCSLSLTLTFPLQQLPPVETTRVIRRLRLSCLIEGAVTLSGGGICTDRLCVTLMTWYWHYTEYSHSEILG